MPLIKTNSRVRNLRSSAYATFSNADLHGGLGAGGGSLIDDAATVRKQRFDGAELVKAALVCLFEGGLRHGLFPGDPYVDDDGRIGFFGFGIMGRIDPRMR